MPAGGDAYLASLVLHDWPDDQAHRILLNIATAGGSGSRVLIIESVVPQSDAPHLSKTSDLIMLGMSGGRERSEAEWRDLMIGAGFTDIRMTATDTPFSVIRGAVP